MKKLLLFVNVDWFFISHRLPVAVEAINQGFEVHIATTITNHSNLLKQNGLIVHHINLHRSRIGISILRELWNFFSIVKSVNPDIVHLVTSKPVLLGGVVARLAGVPAVVSAISGLGFIFSNQSLSSVICRKVISLLYRLALGHGNQKVIFQNIDDQLKITQITKILPDNSILIHGSGVDLSLYSMKPFNTGVPIILLATRLLESKGVKEFVRASKLVNATTVRARFVLVGEVDLLNPESIQQQELDQWDRDGIIEVWGYRKNMHNILPLASIVVLPSYYGEGLPKILIEAAACGRAVITTNHPGCRDAIENNVTGLLIPIRDANAIAEAVSSLLDNPIYCKEMGYAGRKLAERKYSIEKVCEAHMRIYQDLLAEVD